MASAHKNAKSSVFSGKVDITKSRLPKSGFHIIGAIKPGYHWSAIIRRVSTERPLPFEVNNKISLMYVHNELSALGLYNNVNFRRAVYRRMTKKARLIEKLDELERKKSGLEEEQIEETKAKIKKLKEDLNRIVADKLPFGRNEFLFFEDAFIVNMRRFLLDKAKRVRGAVSSR